MRAMAALSEGHLVGGAKASVWMGICASILALGLLFCDQWEEG